MSSGHELDLGEGVMRLKQQWMYFLVVCCMPARVLQGQSYPTVLSVQREFDVSDVGEANVSLNLSSKEGRPIYRVQCHSAEYTGDPEFDYSGDFECRLSSLEHRTVYSTLLTEDVNQSRDWERRGRFFAADLQGECAHIPDFGATRSFELRGMSLTLHIVDPTFTDNKLRSLKLTITVRPDSQAVRPIAKAVPLPTESPSSCKLSQYFANAEATAK